ncbi:addiction module toxin, HicA family protein [Lentilactobacillus fungorum]|uniref:Addiction module toxin, HicA family protein n=1 Tax=Lentilactobacillus fungorum TaxID=2201250 RepID=A0ABQ3VZS1_9LACO|nr:type II toxin-antitoxin system HicA family toxin [Lentilactobacillus fungorum]GHP14248.1 addiction module toxin, HicA family protein [Lentilactobacillus fungorum]
MPMTQKQMVKLLTKHGWSIASGGKGSHVKMEKPGNRPIIVPHGELNKYTERGIRKEAGLL